MGATPPQRPGLDAETVRRVAHLARLSLTGERAEEYRAQLGAVLDHMAVLGSLDLDGVEPMTHPLDATNRMDDDEPCEPLERESLLGMAPDASPPFIKVQRVLER